MIPPTYAKDFELAEKAFLYQRVFDPRERRLVTLTEPETVLSEDDQKWIGLDIEVEIARGMAAGDLHPETREPIQDLWPNYQPSPRKPKPNAAKAPPKASLMGWLTRTPRPKPTPAIAPSHPRIGGLANGPQRISDLPSTSPRLKKHHTEPVPISSPPPAAVKTSKFFPNKARALSEEPDDKFSLKWEDSTHADSQALVPRSASLEQLRSPSPEKVASSPVSTVTNSPIPHILHDEEDDDFEFAGHLTSPMSSHFSTPPQSTSRKVLVEETQMPRPEPSSPTPTARTLVPPSSQMFTAATCASSQRSDEEAYEEEDSAPLLYASRFRPLSSVLVPPSSPAIRGGPRSSTTLRPYSSDSALDDDIVTPSPLAGTKRQRVSMRDENDDERDDEDERARQARAQDLAVGWKEKYALKSTFSSPARIVSGRGGRPPAPSIPVTSASKVKVLAPLSVNVPRESDDEREAMLPSKPTPSANAWPKACGIDATHPPPSVRRPAQVPAPTHTPNPHGLTLSALERFRYSRR